MGIFIVNKGGKVIAVLLGIFSLVLLVLCCCYMTSYTNLNIDNNQGFLQLPVGFDYDSGIIVYDCYNAFLGFNNALFALFIYTIIYLALFLILDNHKRKKYYISNGIAGFVLSVAAIIFAVVCLVLCFNCISNYKMYYDYLSAYRESITNGAYTDVSNLASIISVAVLIIYIILMVIIFIFTILKFRSSKSSTKVVDSYGR